MIQHQRGVLNAPPPILSRVFQELSNGIVGLNNARKIVDFPFPFPFAQMITCMLLLHWLFTPLLTALLFKHWLWCSMLCFVTVLVFWSLNYVATEIEVPF